MTKLETNIANIDGNVDLGEFLQSDLDAVINAARAFSALLKHAPETGALGNRLNSDIDYLDGAYSLHGGKAPLESRSIDYEFGNLDLTLGDLKLIRTTLKAIHDNLTMWGE
jgi:hypothetical protein